MRMTGTRHSTFLFVLAAIFLASCTEVSQTDLVEFSDAAATKVVREHASAVLSHHEPGGLLDGTISTTGDMLDRLSYEERKVVTSFYDQFGSTVFDFQTTKQLEWLLERGYPTPREILAAESVPTHQLLEQFEAGDVKSGYFYLARRSARDDPAKLTLREFQHLNGVARTLLEAGSPFAGYSYFQYQMQLKQDPISAFAGLAWAEATGDSRAVLELGEMVALVERQHPGSVPPVALLYSYRALEEMIAVERPDLLTRRSEPYPFGDR